MSIRRLFEALFLVTLFVMGVRETLDADMWWHLRTGEYILQHVIWAQFNMVGVLSLALSYVAQRNGRRDAAKIPGVFIDHRFLFAVVFI